MGYFKSRHLFLWLLFLVLVFSFMFVVRTSKASVATIQWQCNNGCIADNVIDGQGRPHVSQILTGLVPGGTVTSNSITVKDAMLDLWQASFYPFCKNSKYFIEYTLCHPQPRWSGDNLVWTAAGDPVPHVALYIYSNGTWQAGFYHNDGWGNGWYRVYGTWMVSGLPTPTPVPTPTPTPVPTPTPTPGPNPTPTPTPNPNPTPTPVPTNTPLPPPPVNPPVPTGYCDGPCPVTGSGYYVNVTVSSAYKPTPTPESTPLPLINNDTDGGQNYFLKGTVFFNGQNRTDYCSSASTLNEFFYADNSIRSVSYVCPNGCFDGACAPGDASEEVLGAAITPTPTPVPTPTPLPKIAFHFLAVTCQPASAISGNQAAWYRDMTGARYRQFKNSPNFPAYSPKPVTPQEIPAGSCSPYAVWTFTVSTDRDQRQNITRLGPSGADGAVAFSFVNLTSAQQGALLSGGQLVVSATAPSGRVFGVFRCYMDALYGDNSEKIAINRSSGMPADVYCIAYGLSPVSKPVFQVSAVRTAPKATPKPTPVHSPRPTPPPTPSATATPETTPEVLGAATSNGQQGSCNGIVPSQSNDSAGLEGSLSSFMNSINRIMFTLAFGLAGGIFLLLMFAYIERGRVK